jgi:hypothetical protein
MLLKSFTSFVYWNIFGKLGWTFGTFLENIFGKSELSDSQAFWNYYDVCMYVCPYPKTYLGGVMYYNNTILAIMK